MNEKLKKLSVKISELIPNSETPQQVYDGLTNVMKGQKDYFKYLGPDNIVKLIFYIYSFKTTGKYTLGDSMISSLGFANVITSEGTAYVELCSDCAGEGETDCPLCDRGEMECQRCDGDGEIECPECDGEGRQMGDGEWEDCEECDGTGNVTCHECDGDGAHHCDNCNNGKEECYNCSGYGEIETNETKYDAYFIVTWDKGIKESFELRENTTDPALSEYDFDRLRDEYIVLTYEDDGHAELRSFVTDNEVYCTFYSDEPKLNLTENMRIDNRADNYEPYSYTK